MSNLDDQLGFRHVASTTKVRHRGATRGAFAGLVVHHCDYWAMGVASHDRINH